MQIMEEIAIRPIETQADADAFRSLNEEWITRFFALEKKDREVLEQPREMILERGGHIYLAFVGEEAVGCVALIAMDDGRYELSKMAVRPQTRGMGVGRRLLEYAIEQAKVLGASGLFLGSNSILENAVHLYESVGFRHVPADRLPAMEYARANVFMEMEF